MFPTDVFRTTSFRLAIGASLILAGSMAVVFALITWRSEAFENARIDRLIVAEAATLAREKPATVDWHVERHFDASLRSIPLAAVFGRDGRPLAGDLARMPDRLRPDLEPRRVEATLDGTRSIELRAVATTLPNGATLVIGRDMRELATLRAIALRSLVLAFAPAFLLSLAGGALIGYRAVLRIRDMHRAIERIVAGGLHERLPAAGTADDLDLLAGSVNRMLDRLEALVGEIRGVGDDIAHDLRTPLARVRAGLERARAHATAPDALEAAVDRAVVDLDRVFDMITALLRIAAIGSAQRQAAFAPVHLGDIARDAIELYEPIADGKTIALELDAAAGGTVAGDRDLLMEAVANLVDNAVKFTPSGGRVAVVLADGPGGRSIAVVDNGIGLDPDDHSLVLKRFYRADRSRHVPGNGLGLSLVAAIAALHGAAVEIGAGADGTGSRFALVFGAGRHDRLNDNFIVATKPDPYKRPSVTGPATTGITSA